MKNETRIPLAALGCGIAGLALRVLQKLTGFEPDTGLAKPGNPAALGMLAVLALAAVVLFLLSRKIDPAKEKEGFTAWFGTKSAGMLTVLVMGIFAMAASGALQFMMSVMGGQSVMTADGMMVTMVVMGPVSPRELMILGVLSLASAVCLFPAAAACRKREGVEKEVNGNLLLVPVVCLVVRLVLVYRVNAVDPVLQAYYIELLALVLLTLAFYRLAGFAFQAESGRGFSFWGGLAVVLCITALADCGDITGLLFYGGSALVVLAFLLLLHTSRGKREL